VVYVSATSSCTDNCGTLKSPHQTISSAIAGVPDDGYVLVGPGTYDEGMGIDKPVHVIGLCSAKTVLSGVAKPWASPVANTGIAITDTENVNVSGFSVLSPGVGIAIVGAIRVNIEQVEVQGSTHGGVFVGDGGEAELARVWVHDTGPGGTTGPYGYGIYVQEISDVVVFETLVENATMAGIVARHAGTEVEIEQTTIRATQMAPEGMGGAGLLAYKQATVSLMDVVLERNHDSGLTVAEAATVSLLRGVVRDTETDGEGAYGWGLDLTDDSTATVSGSLFYDNALGGIGVAGAGTEVEVSGTVIQGDLHAGGGFATGMSIVWGADARISGSLFQENSMFGLWAATSGTKLELLGSVVKDTGPDEDGLLGAGLQVSEKAAAVVSKSLLEGNEVSGVGATHSGTLLDMSATVVRGTLPGASGENGMGLYLSEGANATISDCLLHGNTSFGALSADPETDVQLSGTVVRETKPDDLGEYGDGLYAGDGATVKVADCLFEGNTTRGLSALYDGTLLELSGTAVRHTNPNNDGEYGLGMHVGEGAAVTASDCLLEENAALGLWVVFEGTEVDLLGTVVRDTYPDEDGAFGNGMELSYGADATISGCLFDGNTSVGINASDPDTRVELTNTAVRNTNPDESGEFGHGMEVADGATAVVSGCLFEANHLMGLSVAQSGSKVDLSQSVVRDTKPDNNGKFGNGMQVNDGAYALISGCLFEDNQEVGVAAFHSGSQIELSGTVVMDTRPNGAGYLGSGFAALSGAEGRSFFSLFNRNTTNGVASFGEGTSISLDNCALLQTAKGGASVEPRPGAEFQVFGDGLLAAGGSRAELTSTVVMGNGRTGAYYSTSSGEVRDSVIWMSSSYGLAMASCHQDVDYNENGNFIFGNAHALPPELVSQVTTTPGGLPVPDPAKIAELPESSNWEVE